MLRPPAWGLVYGVDIFCLACLCAFVSGFLPRSHAGRPCFCWLLPLPSELVSCRLYLLLSPLWLGMPACLTSRSFVTKSESLTRSIPRSFLVTSLADFAAGLNTDLKLLPCEGPPLVSASGQVSVSRSPFRVPLAPFSRYVLRTRCRFFLGEVISAAEAARPQVGSLRAHDVRKRVPRLSRFHRKLVGLPLSLNQPTWASSSVSSSFSLSDIQHEI